MQACLQVLVWLAEVGKTCRVCCWSLPLPVAPTGILQLRVGDGWQGWPESAPYDAIHVGAAAATVPQALVRQLAPGGRLVLPVGLDGQEQVGGDGVGRQCWELAVE